MTVGTKSVTEGLSQKFVFRGNERLGLFFSSMDTVPGNRPLPRTPERQRELLGRPTERFATAA